MLLRKPYICILNQCGSIVTAGRWQRNRILYKKQKKKTCDPYDRKQYLECRRNTKKAIRKNKQDYVENHVCKLLKKGNSKPFYRHLKGHKAGKIMFRLTTWSWCVHGYWVCKHVELSLPFTISPGPPTVVNTEEDDDWLWASHRPWWSS